MKFKSHVFAQASGSIAGTTYSHNRGGMYVRARATPTNPGSPFQVAIRGWVAALTSAWVSTLTEAQRVAWDLYAEVVPLLDSLGEPRNVGGLGMYIRSNVPRLQAGMTRVDDGPIVYSLPTFTPPAIDSVDAADDEVDVSFTDTDAWAIEVGGFLSVLCSRPQNASINYFKGPYRFGDSIDGAVVPPTSPASIALPFPVAADQQIFVQLRVGRADGRLSLPFRLSGTAV